MDYSFVLLGVLFLVIGIAARFSKAVFLISAMIFVLLFSVFILNLFLAGIEMFYLLGPLVGIVCLVCGWRLGRLVSYQPGKA